MTPTQSAPTLNTITKTVYQCEHCGFTTPDRERAKDHAVECEHIPEKRTCYSCRHGLFNNKTFTGKECRKLGITFAGNNVYAMNCKYWGGEK